MSKKGTRPSILGIRGQLTILRNPQCEACALNNSSVNVCVMGRGSPRSKIVLIGEAPGRAESETGKPFMGQAGQLLNELLEDAGIVNPYITNICKCRPPGNRKPKDDEQATCTKLYLNEELAIIRPRVVVLLGAVSSRWAFPSGFIRGIVNPHHHLIPNDMIACVPTWHPAYYFHSGRDKSVRRQLYQHLLLAKETAYG